MTIIKNFTKITLFWFISMQNDTMKVETSDFSNDLYDLITNMKT